MFSPRRLSTALFAGLGPGGDGPAWGGNGVGTYRPGGRRTASQMGSKRPLPLIEAQGSIPPPSPEGVLPLTTDLHAAGPQLQRQRAGLEPHCAPQSWGDLLHHPRPIFSLSKEIGVNPQCQKIKNKKALDFLTPGERGREPAAWALVGVSSAQSPDPLLGSPGQSCESTLFYKGQCCGRSQVYHREERK